MFGIENYLGFVLAAILLNLTPGTDSMYIITRSVSQGQAAGVYSVLGITTGSFGTYIIRSARTVSTARQLPYGIYDRKIYWCQLTYVI